MTTAGIRKAIGLKKSLSPSDRALLAILSLLDDAKREYRAELGTPNDESGVPFGEGDEGEADPANAYVFVGAIENVIAKAFARS